MVSLRKFLFDVVSGLFFYYRIIRFLDYSINGYVTVKWLSLSLKYIDLRLFIDKLYILETLLWHLGELNLGTFAA